ncbi:hypothetical protein PV326_006379 [Microctonus aethiopoides]|nr:hypothetical protein PV326_006379 [Microctonus aethiopoides]
MLSFLDENNGEPLGTILRYKLICRPLNHDILRCYISESNITLLKSRNIGDDNNSKKINIVNVPFEIKFNQRGINSYIVEKTNPPVSLWELNMIRLIGNQLHIGIDLSDEVKNMFRAQENFTIGVCQVDFKIKRILGDDDYDDETNSLDSNLELVPLIKVGKFSNVSIEIEKKRNIDNCIRRTESFFGTRYILGIIHRDEQTTLTNSESKILISKHNFTSETIDINELFDSNQNKLGMVMDYMGLTLETINPATNSLEKFINPISVGIISNHIEHYKIEY